MSHKYSLTFLFILLVTAACIPVAPSVDENATREALNNAATQTAAAFVTATPFAPSPTVGTAPTDTPASPAQQQFLAYIRDGQLLVTSVTNGVQGGTTQYTVTGESDQVSDPVWSPSGEFVAFVSNAKGEPHIFYIFALGQSSPTDLGPGSAPSWSPDSQAVAYVRGPYPDDNIWVTAIDHPSPRQLTFESNYAWGRPAFTLDENSLVVAGADRNNMGAQGNTSFTLQSLSLDGSGARATLPGAPPLDGMRLPLDLQFSPDGSRLGFSGSSHWSACASPGAYYVIDAIGGSRQEMVSPSLKPAIDPAQEHFHVGLSYAWMPTSDAIVALGNVVDCNLDSPSPGQVIAGPQMSIIGVDGSERTIIPGFFYGISVDRTGTLIAAAHFLEGFQDLDPNIEIYSAQTGQPILSVGSGSNPKFQP